MYNHAHILYKWRECSRVVMMYVHTSLLATQLSFKILPTTDSTQVIKRNYMHCTIFTCSAHTYSTTVRGIIIYNTTPTHTPGKPHYCTCHTCVYMMGRVHKWSHQTVYWAVLCRVEDEDAVHSTSLCTHCIGWGHIHYCKRGGTLAEGRVCPSSLQV